LSGGHGARDLPALTSIRGIAAWWVVLYHVRSLFAPYAGPEVMAFLAKGYLAVDMFFVLSGFVIHLNYRDRAAPTRSAVFDFLFRRIARVYPLHLLLLLAFAGYGLLRMRAAGELPVWLSFESFAASLLLVQGWGIFDYLAWNVPAWSISAELAAYLVFPALALLLAPRWPTWALFAAIPVLAALVWGMFAAAGHANNIGWRPELFGVPRCIAQFANGMICCELWLRGVGGGSRAAPAGCAAAAILAGFLSGWLPETLALPLFWAAALLAVAWTSPRVLRAPPLVYLGEVSYATYLCHYLAFILFKLSLPDVDAVPLWQTGAFLAAVLAASALLYHGFERPAQRTLLAWWRARA
jgi:peptidoglycan/LPS O-acetylase OafA/YrhL